MTPREREEDAGRRFAADVAEHELEVLLDQGLYRHLRFKKPGTGMYWFDVISTPGLLTVNGDMGTFVFSRLDDMLEFFRGGSVNPQYWAQKERTGQDLERFDEEYAKTVVVDSLEDYGLDDDEFGIIVGKLQREVFADEDFVHDDGAHGLVADFECDGFRFSDTWEWSFRTYTYQYLWICHALRWAVQQYDASQARQLVNA